MIFPSSSIHYDIFYYIFDRDKKVICNLQVKKSIVDMVYNVYTYNKVGYCLIVRNVYKNTN